RRSTWSTGRPSTTPSTGWPRSSRRSRPATAAARPRPGGSCPATVTTPLAALLEAVAAGHRGRPPGSVVVLAGDVHHTYLAELSFRGAHAGHGHSPAWRAGRAPVRDPLPGDQRMAHKRAFRRPARTVTAW